MSDHNLQLADQNFRDQIRTNLDCTMLVEAGAGTGKTTCLVDRMVSLLIAGKCSIETLAAVTFTRKAAAELRTRFQLGLERAARGASGEHRTRLDAALAHVERCFIGTIHSFCARLLRERPVEAGVDPAFIELDETVDFQLRELAWREHVATLFASDNPILPELENLGLKISNSTRRQTAIAGELDELGLEPAELGPAFLRFAEYSDVSDWPAAPQSLPDLQPCIQELTEYIDHIRTLSLPSDSGNDKLIPKYKQIERMAKGIDRSKPHQVMELLEEFEGTAKVVQKMWPGKKAQALEEEARWNSFVQRHAEPLLLAWREHRYEPALRAIRPALGIYDRLRREANGLNFQDLLQYSAALLRGKPDVRRYFRRRITHLLVDEFQDTDPIQAEVMLLLTGDDPNENAWQKCRPVPGSLFVVGDPKQSIYRFRRADILCYDKVRSIVEKVGGRVIPLTANFRSIRPVIEWVNRCFDAILPAVSDDYSPANRPLAVGRTDGTDQTSAIEKLLIPATAGRSAAAAAEYEADLIARTIRMALDEQWLVPRTEKELKRGLSEYANPGDFLIVARNRFRLGIYAQKLQQYGIPHAVTGSTVLNDVPELELLQLCLTAIVRSDDPIALVAALRSELFGIADTVLYDFKRYGGRFSYHSEIPPQLATEDAAVLRSVFEQLRIYSAWLRRMQPAAAVARIAVDLGLVARACASEEGDVHAGSLLKAIDLLACSAEQLTIGDYLVAIGRLINQHEPHDGIPVRPPAQSQVRVMNLHQCKGLEAPFVFLVDPTGTPDSDVREYIDRQEEVPRGYLPIYGLKRGQWEKPRLLAQPPGWDTLEAIERRFLDAEVNRLLYVAATRAAAKLVVSQRDGGKTSFSPWQRFDSALAGVKEFRDPGLVIPDRQPAITIDPAEWRNAITAIDGSWRHALQHTYSLQAIKDSAIRSGVKPHGSEPDGSAWGTVIHTILETAQRQPQCDFQQVGLAVLESQLLSAALIQEVLTTVRNVTESGLWKRVAAAQRCLVEVPLAISVPATESESRLPTIQRGSIDLVFLETEGWVVVDYKSERVGSEEIPALVTYYQPQLMAYAKAWKKAVGEPVSECGLFFTHTGHYVHWQ